MIYEVLALIVVALIWCALEVWLSRATDRSFAHRDDVEQAQAELRHSIKVLEGLLAETRERLAAFEQRVAAWEQD